jgi:hypothetical protein
MLTNNIFYPTLRILGQPQTFEILEKSENLQQTKNETLNGKLGFGSDSSSSGSNIITSHNSVPINYIAESDHTISNNKLSRGKNILVIIMVVI